MTMRSTPYLRLRYPWASDTVNAADVQSMAQDVDQALVRTSSLSADFSRFSSVAVQRKLTVQSIPKGVLTAITFDTVVVDNGLDSPLINGAWFNNAAPTRLTAPSPCVVLATGSGAINLGSALGTSGCVQVTIGINGGTGSPNVQGTKWAPLSTAVNQQWASAVSMWKLGTGDWLELRMFWTGTPAGPFNTDNLVSPPTLSLMMVALPSVA
jgi:hypothetical protein